VLAGRSLVEIGPVDRPPWADKEITALLPFFVYIKYSSISPDSKLYQLQVLVYKTL
jgi:hypothetical protein